ncbi:MAG: ABC transporter ATP-binding protein [Peptostreptococcus sp.]|uniref:ABC transporter ATP-binding protein n=1 Tax=Peptostreptococcus sp. TaxID=1262 RepID=UPI002FCCB162
MYKLEMKSINKKYRNNIVLNKMNISVTSGERLSILGPSGCGKSTMLGIMAGIVDDFEGDIFLDGINISNLPSNKRNIVIVSQENLLFPHMNVYDNIGFGLKVRKKEKSFVEKKVKVLLEEIGLKGYENKKVNKLSGGEKQRVALARALAVEPEILLLDEAYSSLDTHLREKMRDLTIKLQKKHSITTILVTHDKQEALLFSNRVGVMLDGEIKQIDTPQNIYEKPNNVDIAKFMLDDNFIDIKDRVLFIKPEQVEILEKNRKNDEKKSEVLDRVLESEKIKKQENIDINQYGNTDKNKYRNIEYIEGIMESSNYSGVSIKHIIKVKRKDLSRLLYKDINNAFSDIVIDNPEDSNKDEYLLDEFIRLKVEDFSKKIYENGSKIVLKIKDFIVY